MSHLHRALPAPTPETEPFWNAALDGRLSLPRCQRCERAYFPPAARCPRCLGDDVEWIDAAGRATLYSYVINHRPTPGYEGQTPYSTALVELEEGPRLVTNVVGVHQTPESLVLGMDLEVCFEHIAPGIALPRFRPAGGGDCR